MKKIGTMILSLIMLLSITAVPASAVDKPAITISEHLAVNLPGENTALRVNDIELNASEATVQISQELDFSNAVDVTSILLTDMASNEAINKNIEVPLDNLIMPLDLPENQAPVGSPEIILMNPDSMRDGNFTTESVFFLAIRWNNTDLCYDPEGSPLELIYNDSFPKGYITRVTDETYGTYDGYLIHIFNRGSYPFAFVLADMYGGHTEICLLNFEIVSRGVFETVEGTLSTVTQVDSYKITVDYSVADSYVLSAMRTGTGGFTINAYDASGTQCGFLATSQPFYATIQKDSMTLKKPEGVTGSYTYTVKVSTSSSKFVDGDTGYKFAYGQENQKFYFFEDIMDAVELPKFTPARTYSQVRNAFVNNTNPSEYGDYYKITTAGPETVTLRIYGGFYRFKVLSATTLETLYDGKELVPYRPSEGYIDIISPTINFAAGQSYYIVVYNSECTDTTANYNICVGDRDLTSLSVEIDIPQLNLVAGVPRTFSFDLDTPTGYPGYIRRVSLGTTPTGFYLLGGKYSVMTPNTSIWTNNIQNDPYIGFGFTDNLPLVNYNGTWQLRFAPEKTGVFPASKLKIAYECEL